MRAESENWFNYRWFNWFNYGYVMVYFVWGQKLILTYRNDVKFLVCENNRLRYILRPKFNASWRSLETSVSLELNLLSWHNSFSNKKIFFDMIFNIICFFRHFFDYKNQRLILVTIGKCRLSWHLECWNIVCDRKPENGWN